MQTNKKIQAFTLSEIIVVLILTSIVVGMAFSVLRLVQKQMFAIQQNYNGATELNKLETVLWLDFNKYPNIRYYGLENKLVLKNTIDSVSYVFSEACIVRKLDTFPIQLEEKTFYFDGLLSKTYPIDAIKLRTNKSFQNRELFIYKQNDATVYLE